MHTESPESPHERGLSRKLTRRMYPSCLLVGPNCCTPRKAGDMLFGKDITCLTRSNLKLIHCPTPSFGSARAMSPLYFNHVLKMTALLGSHRISITISMLQCPALKPHYTSQFPYLGGDSFVCQNPRREEIGFCRRLLPQKTRLLKSVVRGEDELSRWLLERQGTEGCIIPTGFKDTDAL